MTNTPRLSGGAHSPAKPILVHLLALLAAAQLASPARADIFFWDGGGASGNWSDPANWLSNLAPPSSQDTVIVFNSASPRASSSQNIANPLTLNELAFWAGSNHFNIGGQTLTFAFDTQFRPAELVQDSATSVTISNNINLASQLVTRGSGAGSITLGGVISGPGQLQKLDSYTLRITNANTYTAGTRLTGDSGALGVGNNSALGTGTLQVFGDGSHSLFTIGATRTLGNAISLTGSNVDGFGVLTLINNPTGTEQDIALNGAITGDGGLTVNMPGRTATLGGSSANTYSGLTTVTNGTLVLNKTTNTLAMSGNLVIGKVVNAGAADSVSVHYLTNNQTGAGTDVTILLDGLLNVDGRTTSIGSLTMTGGEARIGDGALTLNGNVIINSTLVGSQITSTDFNNDLRLGDASRTFTVLNGTALYDLDVQAGVANGTLVKQGAGTLRLAGNFNTNLSVVLDAGTLAVANNFALGSTGNAFTLAGGTVVADGADRSIGNPVNVTGEGTVGPSVDGLPRALTFTGATNLAVGAELTVSNPAATTFTNVISGAGAIVKSGTGTLALTGSANTFSGGLTVNGGLVSAANDGSLGSNANVVTINSGRLTFSDANVTTARTFVLNTAGTLSPATGGTLTYASGAAVNGGNLGAGGAHLFTNNSSLTGTTGLIGSSLNQTGGTVTFTNVTVRGSFTQAPNSTLNTFGGLTTTSSGALAINGITNLNDGGEMNGVASINSGGSVNVASNGLFLGGGSRTTINSGGTLAAMSGTSIELNGGLLTNNGAQSGNLNVNFGGLAKGPGTFGNVTVNDGGRFSPGASPGTATVSNLSLTSGGRYEFELNSASATPGNGADFTNVLGVIDVAAGTTPNTVFSIAIISLNGSNQPAALPDFDATQSYTYTLATAANGITGFSPNEFTVDTTGFANSLQGGSFAVVQNGNSLELQFMPVPEPSTWALLVGGGLAVLARRRRRS